MPDPPSSPDPSNLSEPAAAGSAAKPAISRRRFVTGLGVAGAVGVGAALVGKSVVHSDSGTSDASGSKAAAVPFYGDHQAGIATPAQDRLLFGAFDLISEQRSDLVALLRQWTNASAQFAAGHRIGVNDLALAPPDDTGEALDLAPARLTITFGFGPTLFDHRFGLTAQRPAALIDLPMFSHDNLDPAISGGDIGVQVCADDPQVAFHALRNLTRIGKGVVGLRWTQLGFGRTSSTSESQETPRNLMGFKDGTNNVEGDDRALMEQQVWVAATDRPSWMHGGSYLVSRRIRMRIEQWDRDFLRDQENVIGRVKSTGAPLGGHHERDPVPLDSTNPDGSLVIPPAAHIRLAAPATNAGARLLRRGYSFTDGVDPVTAGLEAGLFFLAYMRDPRKQFVPIQTRLAENDALNEYIEHTSSAIFAVPPGARAGGYVGETLFGA